MSVCAGKTKCEIYRQKKYCRKTGALPENYECAGCRHAKRQCEVAHCVYDATGRCKLQEVKYD